MSLIAKRLIGVLLVLFTIPAWAYSCLDVRKALIPFKPGNAQLNSESIRVLTDYVISLNNFDIDHTMVSTVCPAKSDNAQVSKINEKRLGNVKKFILDKGRSEGKITTTHECTKALNPAVDNDLIFVKSWGHGNPGCSAGWLDKSLEMSDE